MRSCGALTIPQSSALRTSTRSLDPIPPPRAGCGLSHQHNLNWNLEYKNSGILLIIDVYLLSYYYQWFWVIMLCKVYQSESEKVGIFVGMNGENIELRGKRVLFETLGCKLNFAESSHLGRSLLEAGMELAVEGEDVDLCIVNTCSVTDLADRKSRQQIRRLHRLHPLAKIIVTGCYAQLDPEAIADIEGVDLVVGARDKGAIVEYLLQHQGRGVNGHIWHSAIEEVDNFVPSVSSEGRTRHFLKVQDGCNYRCSYCTIPKARGKSRNGRIADMVAMAEGVAREGGKEIVLTGVNVGDFGRSSGETFMELIEALDGVEGIERFRISSIEPNLITDEVIAFVAQSQRFAPHFHIPLQSGSDEVLRLMRRRYKRELFRHKVELIKEMLPDAFIGVDVIVGMRGEEEAYFEDSYRFISDLPISKLHVFSYSERPGTDALMIDHVVPPSVKHERSQRLLALSEEKHHRFVASQIGSPHRVLVEHGTGGDYLYGFTENYVRVRISPPRLEGQVVDVTLGDFVEDGSEVVWGKMVGCDE